MSLWASIRDDLEVPLVGADDLSTLRQQASDDVVEQVEEKLRNADPSEAKTINMNGRSITGIHTEVGYYDAWAMDDDTANVWLDPDDLLDNDSNETTSNSNNTDMSNGRSWEDQEYQGDLGDIANDEDAFDDGTVDLGHGTEGGEYNVGDDGNTFSDDEVAADDDIARTGNDTVTDTSPSPSPSVPSGNDDGMNPILLAAGGVVAVIAAVVLGGGDS